MEYILVVDDNENMQFILSNVLQEKGYEVECVGNGLDAIKKVRDRIPDLVLLDIRLPKLGGDKIYKNIAMKMPELLDRVIIITASPHQLHDKLPDHDLRVLGKPFRYDMFEFHVSDICPPKKRTA